MAEFRTRNFATIVYPESAPSDWQEILIQTHVPALVSPLHDKDINPYGEVKKEHYHVVILFDNVKTRKQADDLFKSFGGVGCEIVNSVRGYARYLCHLDNPEKAQYDENDVACYAGADFFDLISLPSDDISSLAEMTEFIKDNDIRYFYQFFDYCKFDRPDWFRTLMHGQGWLIKEYIKSYDYKSHVSGGDT